MNRMNRTLSRRSLLIIRMMKLISSCSSHLHPLPPNPIQTILEVEMETRMMNLTPSISSYHPHPLHSVDLSLAQLPHQINITTQHPLRVFYSHHLDLVPASCLLENIPCRNHSLPNKGSPSRYPPRLHQCHHHHHRLLLRLLHCHLSRPPGFHHSLVRCHHPTLQQKQKLLSLWLVGIQ